MNLNLAIEAVEDLLEAQDLFSYTEKAFNVLISHAEAHRWRKLADEKPTRPGWYDVWLPEHPQESERIQRRLWKRFAGGYRFNDIPGYLRITHWKHRVGPEES